MCLVCLFSGSALAEQIKTIYLNGEIQLSNGEKAVLAGLHLTEEGVTLLGALIASKEVEVQNEKDRSDSPLKPVYLSIKTQELDFPFFNKDEFKGKKVMVNELLLAWGAAIVDEKAHFKKKGKYLEIQNQARKKGEGLWSYETLQT